MHDSQMQIDVLQRLEFPSWACETDANMGKVPKMWISNYLFVFIAQQPDDLMSIVWLKKVHIYHAKHLMVLTKISLSTTCQIFPLILNYALLQKICAIFFLQCIDISMSIFYLSFQIPHSSYIAPNPC